MKEKRLERTLNNMQKNNLDQILITSTSSIFYLTGKWIQPGERLLALYLNSNGDKKLFINELFPIKEDIGVDMEVYNDTEEPIDLLAKIIDCNKTLGVDKEWPSRFLIKLMNKKKDLKVINGSFIVDETRMIKDNEEIELMRQASRINDQSMDEIIKLISEEYNEKKMCKLLAEIYEKNGADSYSFDPLIAYGPNAAEPHHDSDNSMVGDGDSVILDIGCRFNKYCSDMTRTIFYKKPKDEYKDVYNIVLEANLKGIEAVKPGARFCDIDNASRNHIASRGYGEYFTHRTGHNIGIDVHEFPDVSSVNEMIVEKGMIFSVEPGIYLPGKCGVRIEDLVVVTEDGCEVLNSYPKEFKIVG